MNINMQTFYTEDGILLRGILSRGKEENETVVVHINGRGSGQFNNMTSRMRNFYIQNNVITLISFLTIKDFGNMVKRCSKKKRMLENIL